VIGKGGCNFTPGGVGGSGNISISAEDTSQSLSYICETGSSSLFIGG